MAYIEPNCDMPWEIYLDWLEDQGSEDLRFIYEGSFLTSDDLFISMTYPHGDGFYIGTHGVVDDAFGIGDHNGNFGLGFLMGFEEETGFEDEYD